MIRNRSLFDYPAADQRTGESNLAMRLIDNFFAYRHSYIRRWMARIKVARNATVLRLAVFFSRASAVVRGCSVAAGLDLPEKMYQNAHVIELAFPGSSSFLHWVLAVLGFEGQKLVLTVDLYLYQVGTN